MNEVAERVLTGICEKLGVGVEMVWGAYLKQSPIWMFSKIAMWLSSAVLIILSMRAMVGRVRKSNKGSAPIFDTILDNHPLVAILMSVLGVCLLFIAVDIATSFGDMAAAFLNPEYWAFSRIFRDLSLSRH